MSALSFYFGIAQLAIVFASLGYVRGEFPESERAADESLSLPVYPELTDVEQEFVIEKVREFYAK